MAVVEATATTTTTTITPTPTPITTVTAVLVLGAATAQAAAQAALAARETAVQAAMVAVEAATAHLTIATLSTTQPTRTTTQATLTRKTTLKKAKKKQAALSQARTATTFKKTSHVAASLDDDKDNGKKNGASSSSSSSGGGSATDGHKPHKKKFKCPITRDEYIYSYGPKVLVDKNAKCTYADDCHLHPADHEKHDCCARTREAVIEASRYDKLAVASQRCRYCFCLFNDHKKHIKIDNADHSAARARNRLKSNIDPALYVKCAHSKQAFAALGLPMDSVCLKCGLRYDQHDDDTPVKSEVSELLTGMRSVFANNTLGPLNVKYNIDQYPLFQNPKDKRMHDPTLFINELDIMLDMEALPDPSKKKMLLLRTHGVSQAWIKSDLIDAIDPATGLAYTWNETLIRFRKHFELPGQRDVRMGEWHLLHQYDDEMVVNYYNRLAHHARGLDFDLNEQQVITMFDKGLLPGIRDSMNQAYYSDPINRNRSSLAPRYSTLAEVFDLAIHAERMQTAKDISNLDAQRRAHGNNKNSVQHATTRATLDAAQIDNGSRAHFQKKQNKKDENDRRDRDRGENKQKSGASSSSSSSSSSKDSMPKGSTKKPSNRSRSPSRLALSLSCTFPWPSCNLSWC